MPDLHPLIAEAAGQTKGNEVGQVARFDVAGDTQRQPPFPAETGVTAEGSGAFVSGAFGALIVDADDAQTVQVGGRGKNGGLGAGVTGRRNVVAHQVPGQFAQDAGRLAAIVLIHHAGCGVRGIGSDAGQAQSGAVDPRNVQVAAPEHGRPGAGGAVEVAAIGKDRNRPATLVPAVAQNPGAGRERGGVGGDAGEGVVQAGRFAQVDAPSPQGHTMKMDVGIGEAGQDQGAVEIEDGGIIAGQVEDLLGDANGLDAAVLDSDSLGPGQVGPLRVESGIEEDEGGGHGEDRGERRETSCG